PADADALAADDRTRNLAPRRHRSAAAATDDLRSTPRVLADRAFPRRRARSRPRTELCRAAALRRVGAASVSVPRLRALRAGRGALRADSSRDARARRLARADAPRRGVSRQAAPLLLARARELQAVRRRRHVGSTRAGARGAGDRPRRLLR